LVKKSVNTLINKCILNESIIFVSEDENGNPVAVQENSPIPSTVLQEIHDLHTEGLSFEDAIVNIRGALVPTGYAPYPFRKDTSESFLDILRSVVATCTEILFTNFKWKVEILHTIYMFLKETRSLGKNIMREVIIITY
jgi:hypothetical protein